MFVLAESTVDPVLPLSKIDPIFMCTNLKAIYIPSSTFCFSLLQPKLLSDELSVYVIFYKLLYCSHIFKKREKRKKMSRTVSSSSQYMILSLNVRC